MIAPTRTLRGRILDAPLTAAVLKRLGVNAQQYRLLLDLFRTLGARLEFMGVVVSATGVAGYCAAFSALISLAVLFRPAYGAYLRGVLAFNMFLLLWTLLEDAANSILNPEEAATLAHQPIGGATYVLAKLTHILYVLGIFVPALNGLPAVSGLYLDGSRWFSPFTHLVAAYLAGLFIAFLICAICGWLLRFVPPARLKNAVLWLQFAIVLSPVLLQRAQQLIGDEAARKLVRSFSSSWFPWSWFASVGLVGHAGGLGLNAWQVAIAAAVTSILILAGIRTLRQDYLINASIILQGGASRPSRLGHRGLAARLVSRLTGAPSGYAAFEFADTMMRRDWHFRRQVWPFLFLYGSSVMLLVIAGLKRSPFVEGSLSVRAFSPIHFATHIVGMLCLLPAVMMRYTAEPAGSWIFGVVPIGRLRPFARGIYLSLWLPVALIHILMLGPCIWFWGVGPAALFVLFGVAMVSIYVSAAAFVVSSVPFTQAFVPGKTNATLPLLLGFFMALILGVLQWLVFHSMALVLSVTPALIVASCVIGFFSLRRLEQHIRTELQLLALPPQQIFKTL